MTDILSRFKVDTSAKRWLQKHLDYDDPEFCLIWPFSRAQNGYGAVGRNGYIRPHRIMCEYRNGPPPSPNYQAAHSCGRGHDGCVNPWHLNWKTPADNQRERYQQSGLVPRAKLTPAQVDEIRTMKGRERTVDSAQRFGVSEANIRQIQSGKIWTKESTRRRPFTQDEVLHIRSTPWQVTTAKQFAQQFGVSYNIIQKLRSGATYRWVEHNTHKGE